MERLAAQIHFLLVCDQLKTVIRTTTLHDGSRYENSAEHSWHLALMAVTLSEHAPKGTDIQKVVRLLLVHDLVEIHAGDTFFAVSAAGLQEQSEKEAQAASALFGLLPADQQQEFQTLWEEFEAQETREAHFAKALDALQPMLLTWGGNGLGCTERHPDLTREKLLDLKQKPLQRFPSLWAYARQLLDQAASRGTIPSATVPD
ncbi:HD domain-containing protein [Deinococcus cellulosilyticus]|uniref:Phosphohydrolase n=1 Tax=Deinococcus cellulosilyticus (strain DSM 18568 / NBRC 106333 / KACC 11606 / 5516J-15) TaxID=1223518 RepID=A0A511MWQ9_DEIC1|nr:HD domain-containing protein [Deinococcus cellulosilyticus]GEM44607.1 phosphohydrolase [Deinococcus cellulosilyticus NBRC 106333 = KACC 11606]